jgi:phage host-nuclease inhibitor protein Gam
MMSREEYVERMKKQLDDWNAKLAEWETEVQKTQASVKAQYEAQIEALRKQRDETLRRLQETRDASQAAWMEVSKGLESAWKTMYSSFDRAWSEFHKKKPSDR